MSQVGKGENQIEAHAKFSC